MVFTDIKQDHYETNQLMRRRIMQISEYGDKEFIRHTIKSFHLFIGPAFLVLTELLSVRFRYKSDIYSNI